MVNVIIYVSMFLIGIFFGSFFTLAVYRIPLGQDITHTHSYCPNCKHKLGFLDLFPVFSYVFLGGKCRYCKQKIRPRYLILELLSGLVFVLFAMSFNLNPYILEIDKIMSIVFGILYFVSIFIIAGIDKEKYQIQRGVIIYGIVVSLLKTLYLGLAEGINVSNYIVAIAMLIVLVVAHSSLLKEEKFKNSVWNYSFQIVTLALYMLIATGKTVFMPTLVSILVALILYVIIDAIRKGKKDKSDKKELENKEDENNIPVGFMMCSLNVLWVLIANFLWYYIV